MNATDQFGLPRYVGDGLLLRWATPGDADDVAAFNVAMHSDDPDQPELWIADWTKLLMSGEHPTTSASDFTVVVDEKNDNRVVSSLCLISQTWRYEDVDFPVGRPELVATHSDYRRRGLVREQMDVIHALSASRGERLNAITGIPWYYRQFGYEMTVNLHGRRKLYWSRLSDKEQTSEQQFSWRPPAYEETALLSQLYDIHCAPSLLACVRDDKQWHFEIDQTNDPDYNFTTLRLIEDGRGKVVGYCEYHTWEPAATIGSLAVLPGNSWRSVCLWLVQRFRQLSDERVARDQPAFPYLNFELGEDHPAYDALGTQLEPLDREYSWYIRVPDLAAFLSHIGPVLERRLAASAVAGYTGRLLVDMYTSTLALVWEEGKLVGVEQHRSVDEKLPRGHFPDLSFLHLLLGHRTLADLEYAWTDCRVSDPAARVLFEALFLRRASCVIPVW